MMNREFILVTGGCGYIGSHIAINLLKSSYQLVVLDNFSNSSKKVIERIRKISNKTFKVIEGDISDRNLLKDIFRNYRIKGVIHLASLKAVGEAERNPISYYKNNVNGSLILFEEMEIANVKTIVFSSSATVYGQKKNHMFSEEDALEPYNVYGRTKLIIENLLKDIHNSSQDWKILILRYFNPIGAHSSGLIGDNPFDSPSNLLPFITQVAIGKRNQLLVFGDDYPTLDGTCKRDYIHVSDLAEAHFDALNYLFNNQSSFLIFNLGTGKAYSVLEVIKIFEEVTGIHIPFRIVDRRSGDVAESLADPTKAKNILGWEAKLDLYKMCQDSWLWQKQNPNGI